MEDRKAHLAVLKATPARLRAALKGIHARQARERPAPGKWSILEIVCHLRDMERDAYLARYRRILAEDRPTLPDVDGDALAISGDYGAQKLSAVAAEWRQLRQETLRVLRGVKGDAWSRVGVHETGGPLTMDDFLRRHAVGNDQAHLGQIEGIAARRALLLRLATAPDRLRLALGALPPATLAQRPPRGTWSAIEHASHLRDADLVYVERLSRTAFTERPRFWIMDNDLVAERLRYREGDPAAVVKVFQARREEILSLLRVLPAVAWQRIGIHPEAGELTVEQLATRLADHDDHHLAALGA